MTGLILLAVVAVIVLVIIFRKRFDWTNVGDIIGGIAIWLLDVATAVSKNGKRDSSRGNGGSSGGGGDSGSF